jgi:glycosyltransferase 2 family protein
MTDRLWNRALQLTAVTVAFISGVSVWLTWRESTYSAGFSWFAFTPALVAAFISYALRTLRFYYLLSRGGIDISLVDATAANAVGFALAITPGRIGEIFKLHIIRERTGAPIARTAPLMILDRLIEGGGLTIIAIAAALALPAFPTQMRSAWLAIPLLGSAAALALTRKYWIRFVFQNSWLLRSRFGNNFASHVSNFWLGLGTGFTPKQIVRGLGLTALARFGDGLVVLMTAQMMGVSLSLPEAVFVLSVSGLAGGFSLLPVGIGAVEATMTGLLAIMGAPISSAITISLLTRLATIWIWVTLGLGLAVWLRLIVPSYREENWEGGGRKIAAPGKDSD